MIMNNGRCLVSVLISSLDIGIVAYLLHHGANFLHQLCEMNTLQQQQQQQQQLLQCGNEHGNWKQLLIYKFKVEVTNNQHAPHKANSQFDFYFK